MTKRYNGEFGYLVQKLRLQKRFRDAIGDESSWTQEKLSEIIGLSPKGTPILSVKQIRDIEQGTTAILRPDKHLEPLAGALGLSEDQKAAFYAVAGYTYPYRDKERDRKIVTQLLNDRAFPYLFPREHRIDNIRWLTNYLEYTSEQQKKIIETGIETFRLIVESNSQIEEIAHKVGAHGEYLRATIKSALRSRTLQIIGVARDNNLEARLEGLFNNFKAIVADIPDYDNGVIQAELVAFLATGVLTQLPDQPAIGVGSGYTLLRFAELSTPRADRFTAAKWIPLMQAPFKAINHLSSNHIACLLANQHPGSEALYFPHMHHKPSDYALIKYNEIMELSHRLSTIFISINGTGKVKTAPQTRLHAADGTTQLSWDTETLLGKKHSLFVGEILGMFLDANSKPIEITPEGKAVYTDLALENKHEILQILRDVVLRGRVWIVAVGEYKAKAILMAIENGLCNGVVIGSEIAKTLIALKEEKNRQPPLF